MKPAPASTHSATTPDLRGPAGERFYRQLFDDNPHPMWIYDMATLEFLAVNDAAVAHYGYSREEFRRMSILDIRPTEDVPALLEDIHKVADGLHNAGIWRHRKRDGSLLEMEITTHTMDYFGRKAKVVLAFDVTERRRAEMALQRVHAELEMKVAERTAELTRANEVLEQEIRLRRESEDRFRLLFEQSPDAIFVEDIQGNVLDANPAACRLHNLTREQLIGRNVRDLVPPESRALVAERNARLVSGELDSLEAFSLTSDGRSIPTEIRVSRVRYANQPALLLHVRDISERRKAEDERRQFPARLLEAQEAERRQISQVIHDELGQLLTLARMDLASLHVGDNNTAKSIRSAIQKLDETMASLRRMAISLRPPMLDDLGLVAAMETLAEDFSRSSNIPVHFVVEGQLPKLSEEHETCLYRMQQEALTNIVKHAGATCVHITLAAHPYAIRLDIQDNGRGLSWVAAKDHAGIGLIGIRERLARCGGDLCVESDPDQGTRLSATIKVRPTD